MGRSTTKLEEEKRRKRKAEEEGELVDWLGQDSEVKGAQAVKEVQKEEEKKELKKEFDNLEILYGSRQRAVFYRERLRTIARSKAKDLPQNQWSFELTSKGIVLWLRKNGKLYARGMQISGLPLYDLNGIDRMIFRAEDFLNQKEQNGSLILN